MKVGTGRPRAQGRAAKFAIALGPTLPLGSPEGSPSARRILSLGALGARKRVASGSRIDRKVVHIARKSLDLLAFRGEGPVWPFNCNRDEACEHIAHRTIRP